MNRERKQTNVYLDGVSEKDAGFLRTFENKQK